MNVVRHNYCLIGNLHVETETFQVGNNGREADHVEINEYKIREIPEDFGRARVARLQFLHICRLTQCLNYDFDLARVYMSCGILDSSGVYFTHLKPSTLVLIIIVPVWKSMKVSLAPWPKPCMNYSLKTVQLIPTFTTNCTHSRLSSRQY